MMSGQAKTDAELDDHAFDNDVVCPAVYKWVKGDGPEPYSSAVASLTALVCDLINRDRKRRAVRRCHHTRCEAGTRKCLDCGDYVP